MLKRKLLKMQLIIIPGFYSLEEGRFVPEKPLQTLIIPGFFFEVEKRKWNKF